MQAPIGGEGSLPPYTVGVDHHETNELLVKQEPIPVEKLERPLLLLRKQNNCPSFWTFLILTWSI
jgi:hypothetical protein